MSTIGKGQASAITALAALMVLFGGCGGGGSDSTRDEVKFGGNTLARCLKENGAEFAVQASELSFFQENSSSMFATYLDKPTKLSVQIWRPSEDPRDWLLWQAQP